VFSDAAFTLSEVSKDAGRKLEPSTADQEALKHPGADDSLQISREELENQATQVSEVIAEGASKVIYSAESRIADIAKGSENDTLLSRLRQAVMALRRRLEYTDSVSTLSSLLKRYIIAYSYVASDTAQAVEDDISKNEEVDRALKNFWSFLKSFGDPMEWDRLEQSFEDVVNHGREDADFDSLVGQVGDALQEMLTDPSFFDQAEQRFQDLRAKIRELSSESSLRADIDGLLEKLQSTARSVLQDQDVTNILKTSSRIIHILSPAHQYTNGDLIKDAIHVFVPVIIQAIQYIPIPRLEVANPQVDLLLENLILEPGVTINHSSFLPYKLRIETYNDLEIRKARFRTAAATKTRVTIKIDGISIRAEEIGFWLQAHAGLFRLIDEGIASFELDERGIDIHLDVEVGRDSVEKILALRAVRVHIHKFTYTLRKSKFAFLAWICKPLLRRIIRHAMEAQMTSAIRDALHAANREILFARERLRAARIADPDDLRTFVKAVAARLVPPDDPDLYTRIGVGDPDDGVFKGRYAPGSIVKLWNEEAVQARQRVREHGSGGWRNDIFNVHATMMT
jgi:hypothetical protein